MLLKGSPLPLLHALEGAFGHLKTQAHISAPVFWQAWVASGVQAASDAGRNTLLHPEAIFTRHTMAIEGQESATKQPETPAIYWRAHCSTLTEL
jgi:hypothetical protein